MEDVTIKVLDSTDLDEFFSFFSTNLQTQFPEYSPKVKKYMLTSDHAWSKAVYEVRLNGRGRMVWGAFVSGQLVGILDVTQPEFGVSYCSWILVDPKWQKKGIGKKLLSEWEITMKKLGAHSLYLYADQRNESFYKKRGFTLVGVHKKAWFGLDSLYFTKQIQEPNKNNYLLD